MKTMFEPLFTLGFAYGYGIAAILMAILPIKINKWVVMSAMVIGSVCAIMTHALNVK
jgi:hypothetical protein